MFVVCDVWNVRHCAANGRLSWSFDMPKQPKLSSPLRSLTCLPRLGGRFPRVPGYFYRLALILIPLAPISDRCIRLALTPDYRSTSAQSLSFSVLTPSSPFLSCLRLFFRWKFLILPNPTITTDHTFITASPPHSFPLRKQDGLIRKLACALPTTLFWKFRDRCAFFISP